MSSAKTMSELAETIISQGYMTTHNHIHNNGVILYKAVPSFSMESWMSCSFGEVSAQRASISDSSIAQVIDHLDSFRGTKYARNKSLFFTSTVEEAHKWGNMLYLSDYRLVKVTIDPIGIASAYVRDYEDLDVVSASFFDSKVSEEAALEYWNNVNDNIMDILMIANVSGGRLPNGVEYWCSSDYILDSEILD